MCVCVCVCVCHFHLATFFFDNVPLVESVYLALLARQLVLSESAIQRSVVVASLVSRVTSLEHY